ncbi:SAM-dependent DNA methyltransferase, partial [Salmonella enterica subsp. enterica serovar Enteritidis]|nr:SAM-dependent DNA methyltransferase [Salmonella enterica subsp. enterica serovar Enteritidis]
MKKTDELLKKKLIKQIQAISDNTHKSFSAFAFAAAT